MLGMFAETPGGHSQATQMARADAADVADRVLQNAIASEQTAQTATAAGTGLGKVFAA